MKKNGFIATSLIYSFFLIFITLFLTIIAEGLQQKLWLNEIEKGIKDEINSSMGIKDFEVGNVITSSSYLTPDTNTWIIGKIEIDNEVSTNNSIFIYSYETFNSVNEEQKLTYDLLKSDLEYGGVYNNTYLKKLAYIFNGDYFNLDSKKIEKNSDCLVIDNSGLNNSACSDTNDAKYRKRIKVNIGNKRYTKETSQDGDSITITGEI